MSNIGLILVVALATTAVSAVTAKADDSPAIRFVHACPKGTGLVWHGDTPSCEPGAPTHGDEGNQGSPLDLQKRPNPV